jgi:hypothetical protein
MCRTVAYRPDHEGRQKTSAEGHHGVDNLSALIPPPYGLLLAPGYVYVQDRYVSREVAEFHPVVPNMKIR